MVLFIINVTFIVMEQLAHCSSIMSANKGGGFSVDSILGRDRVNREAEDIVRQRT